MPSGPSEEDGDPRSPEEKAASFYGVSPQFQRKLFRPDSDPRTPDQDAQLQAETINNKPFIHIPVKIRRLFHENEATDYMQKTAAFLTRAVSTREKALHLHDITRRSLSSNIDNNMNLSVAGILTRILREHAPKFRYGGRMIEEIEKAFWVSKPWELGQIKIVFKDTSKDVFTALKVLNSTHVTNLGGSRAVYLADQRIASRNKIQFRCPDSCIPLVAIKSQLVFRLAPFDVDVIACEKIPGSNLFRAVLSGLLPPYDLVVNPRLTILDTDMCINFDKKPPTCPTCYDVTHTYADCPRKTQRCQSCGSRGTRARAAPTTSASAVVRRDMSAVSAPLARREGGEGSHTQTRERQPHR